MSEPARSPESNSRRRIGSSSIGAQPPERRHFALAVGALAFGVVALGVVAIGRLAIGRARIRRLDIDELVVGKLRVKEERRPAES